jgi:hypothetical protein
MSRGANLRQLPCISPMHHKIPAFSAAGERLGSIGRERAERLVRGPGAVGVRNRRRQLVEIHFRLTDGGADPLRASATGGQCYSYEEQLVEHRAWTLRPLETGPEDYAAVVMSVCSAYE